MFFLKVNYSFKLAMYWSTLEEIVYRYQKVSFLSINDFSFNFRLCCVFCLFLYNNQI